jgi:hypothetical protein
VSVRRLIIGYKMMYLFIQMHNEMACLEINQRVISYNRQKNVTIKQI